MTRYGKLRRLRQLARTALDSYGLVEAPFSLVRHAGNTLYRVKDREEIFPNPNGDLFKDHQYLLRIYAPDWQAPEAIQLELNWLAAMRREADLPVQEPIPTPDGKLLTQVIVPGLPEPRYCSLLRWVKGREISHKARAHDYRAQGKLMAHMHNFAENWQLPAGGFKRRYDWDGLFRNDPEIGLPPGECWKYLPEAWARPFETVAQETRQVMDSWGQKSDVFGLIHADMGMDANILFWRGHPRLIDFDGSGFGYWMYDLAVATAHLQGKPEHNEYRETLLNGYAEARSLPQKQLDRFDLFLAAFSVYYALWMVGVCHINPENREHFQPILDQAAGCAIQYAANFQ